VTRIGTLLVVCLLALPLRAQTPDWQTFESARGGFRVAFPAAPIVKRGKQRTEIGDILTTRYSAGDGAEAVYDLTYNDYPRQGIAKLSADRLMDAVLDGLVYQSKGKLVSEKPFAAGNFTGREHDIEGQDGMRYRIRLLLVGNRLYQLTAMARPPARADERKFFNSFQLTSVTPP